MQSLGKIYAFQPFHFSFLVAITARSIGHAKINYNSTANKATKRERKKISFVPGSSPQSLSKCSSIHDDNEANCSKLLLLRLNFPEKESKIFMAAPTRKIT